MTVKLSDPLVGPSRITARQVMDWYRENFDRPVPREVALYLSKLAYLCKEGNIDFLFPAFQSIHETTDPATNIPWTSFWWKTKMIAAGQGITGDPVQNAAAQSFPDGMSSAIGHYAHLLPYIFGLDWHRHWPMLELGDPQEYDNRFVEVFNAGFAGSVNTIGDFGGGRWATDPNYAKKIVDRANDALRGTELALVEKVRVRKNILPVGSSNRSTTKLPGAGDVYFVMHETGNEREGAGAASQVQYLQSFEASCGPDPKQRCVSYHGSVDDNEFVQGLPFDIIGYHAGDGCDDPVNDIGCFRSIAIEMCVNQGADEAQMRRNAAQIIARIAAGDPAFDWGSGSTRGRFSIEQIKQHLQVSTPGPNQHHCPDHMLREGFWPEFMRMVDEEWAIWGTTPVPPKYPAVNLPEWWADSLLQAFPADAKHLGITWRTCRRNVVMRRGSYPYTEPNYQSAHAGPTIAKGLKVQIERQGVVQSVLADGTKKKVEWLMAHGGYYLPSTNVSPRISIVPRPE